MKRFQKSKGGKKGKSGTAISTATSLKAQPLQDKAIDFIKGGNIEGLAKMCEEGSDEIKFLNKFHSKNGKTSMCVACEEGRLEAVEILLDAKAAVDLVDKNGMAPVLYAAQAGEKEIIELLHEAGANLTLISNSRQENALMLACTRNHQPVVEVLVRLDLLPIEARNSASETALAIALKFEYYAIAEFLLGATTAEINSPGTHGNTALIRSAFDGRVKTTQYCLERGANVNAVNCNGETALMVAVRHGHHEIVDLLLQHGANVDVQDAAGRTALMVACCCGRPDYAKMLLDKPAQAPDPNIVDSWGYSALTHLCVRRQNADGLQGAADLQLTDPERLGATWHGLVGVIDLLLERGAWIDAMDKNFCTPLMHCCQRGLVHVALLLLERGAAHQFTDLQDRSAAQLINDPDLRRFFEQQTAAVTTSNAEPSSAGDGGCRSRVAEGGMNEQQEQELFTRPGVRRKPGWVAELNEQRRERARLQGAQRQEELVGDLQRLQEELAAAAGVGGEGRVEGAVLS